MQNFDAKSTDVAYLGNRREISSRLLSDINPKGCGGGSKRAQWSEDCLSFLSGSCYGHKNS